MELKEMEYTAVIINTPEEYDKYVCMCARSGWKFMDNRTMFLADLKRESHYLRTNSIEWGTVSGNVYNRTLITLTEFRKEQNIMKYSEGDVLVNGSSTQIIQGSLGKVYMTIDEDGDIMLFTEDDLESNNYTLQTHEPITELTLEQVAEKMNIPVSQLRIKD